MPRKYQELHTKISDEDTHEIIEKVARFIAERGLAPAGILLIESLHPLHSIGSQAMFFLLPFAEIVLDSEKYQHFALMIQKEENVQALVKRIDELDEELFYEKRKAKRLKRKRRRNLMKERINKLLRIKKKAE